MTKSRRTAWYDVTNNRNLHERPSFWSYESVNKDTAEAFVFNYMKQKFNADVVRSGPFMHYDGIVRRSDIPFLPRDRRVEVKFISGDRIKFFYDPVRRLVGPEGVSQLTWLERENAVVFFLQRGGSREIWERGAPFRNRQWIYTIYIIDALDINPGR